MAIANDMELKVAIADRMLRMLTDVGITATKTECLMDIDFVDEVCPLRLRELLDADDSNFCHDIFGIYQHFNRRTKQPEDCFLPRFAK